jgi:hypothetical protein
MLLASQDAYVQNLLIQISKKYILFLGFFVLGVLALNFAKFGHLKLAFHRLGLVGKVIDVFARRALQLHVRFLFCCHIKLNC